MEVSELHDISQPFGLASCHEQRLLLMAALDLSIIYLVSSYHYQKRNTRTQNVQALPQNLNDNPILDLLLDIIAIFVRQDRRHPIALHRLHNLRSGHCPG